MGFRGAAMKGLGQAIAGLLRLARQGIEACGRHPFATGLFALLGLFGLAFSIYDSYAAQQQSTDAARTQSEIKSGIATVAQAVAAGQTDAEDREGFDPIEAAVDLSPPTDDNVIFDPAYLDEPSLDFSAGAILGTIAWLQRNDPCAVSDFLAAEFTVKSVADREFVQIAPYIVVEVLGAEKLRPDLAYIDASERGAGASVREFSGVVMPQKGLQFIPLIDPDSGEIRRDIDYFTLQPREPEEFVLYLNTMPDYRFDLRIGLHYKFMGKHGIHWVSKPFATGATLAHSRLQWSWETDGRFARPGSLAAPQRPFDFRQPARDQRAFAEQGKVFRPSQIPAAALEVR